MAWSPLTLGWEMSFVRLILFRKTLGLTGSMASQRVRASKATRGHKDGNLRPQRSEPTAKPAWDQCSQNLPSCLFAKSQKLRLTSLKPLLGRGRSRL